MKIRSGKQPKPRRTMMYGVHGVGKSTWAAQAPGALFLDLEDGLNDIDCDSSPHLTTFEYTMDALRWLSTSEHEYTHIAVDTIDHLERLIHRDIAKAAGKESIADIGYGAGYKQALKQWDTFIFALDWLRSERGIGVILLAHSEIKRFDSPELDSYDRYQPALHATASALLQEWSDEVLFASYRVFTRTEDQGFNKERAIAVDGCERFIRTQESAAVLAKNRLGMPPEIGFTWAEYAAYFPRKTNDAGNINGVVIDGSSKKKTAEASEVVA